MEKKNVKKEEFGLKEYFEWRNNNEKTTYSYVMNFVTLTAGLLILVLLILWMTGQLPNHTITETCTVIKTGIGG